MHRFAACIDKIKNKEKDNNNNNNNEDGAPDRKIGLGRLQRRERQERLGNRKSRNIKYKKVIFLVYLVELYW